MAIPIGSALLSTVVALLLFTSALASSELPFIIAHKKASLNRLKSGVERVLVSIDIYNQGSSTAYDVSLSDDSWPQDIFEVVSGNTSKSWERLDAGAIVSHSFELEAKEKLLFNGAPALVTFRIPTKAALQESYSTPIFPLDVLADRPPEKKFEWRFLAKYGSLISVVSIVVLFVYLVASPSKSGAAKGSKKKR
ncbi:translocon-associated protein subunit beta-like [Pyrus ussuriensis x Pyrus communis]|uniref:Translocon-associated protein subunit beta-like n=1 Tax=Pyrus ussuriensis x Pyrus communis TaxID=2448454 RepID=A0A5N5G8I0_9ROSA|nr:translocon-associated protein subunit beta-like [Pyrus ussuriensis x Pyrus communis]